MKRRTAVKALNGLVAALALVLDLAFATAQKAAVPRGLGARTKKKFHYTDDQITLEREMS